MAITVDIAGPARGRWSAGQDPVTVALVPITPASGSGIQGQAIQGSIALPVQGGFVGVQGGPGLQGGSSR